MRPSARVPSSTLLCLAAGLLTAGAFALVAFVPLPAMAAAFPDSVLARWRDYQRIAHVPGLAVVLVRDSGVVAEAYLGERDVERHRPVTRKTRFYIASCTKPFVATALWTLSAEGRLDLDAPVRGYLPGFRLADPGASDSLTVRDLLAHRRGLNQRAIGVLTAYSGQMTDARMAYWLARVRPRNRFAYSNLHYIIAGRVLAALTGTTWQRAVEDRVLRPLGMDRGALRAAQLSHDPDAARPYQFRDGRLTAVASKSDNTMHAAGGMGASSGDLARWLRAQLGDGALDGRQVLPAALARGMRVLEVSLDDRHPVRSEQRRVGWTAGWEVRTLDRDTMYVHGGGYVGAAASFSFVPALGVGVAVMINGGEGAVPEIVAAEAYDWIAGRPSPLVAPRLEQLVARGHAPGASDSLPHRPSRPAADYPGTFSNEHWGDVVVARSGEDVTLRLGEYAMPLAWSGPDSILADGDTPGWFERDAGGRVRAVVLKLAEPDTARFVRR